MSHLGEVQSSAATTIGLQSPEILQIDIEMLENGNEQRKATFEIAATVTDDKNEATTALGAAQASQTRLDAFGGMAGSTTDLFISIGTQAYGYKGQEEVGAMKQELSNIGSFKAGMSSSANDIIVPGESSLGDSSLKAIPENEVNLTTSEKDSVIKGNESTSPKKEEPKPATESDDLFTESMSEEALEFKKKFENSNWEERAALFKGDNPEHFKNLGKAFSGDAEMKDALPEVQQNLRMQIKLKSEEIQTQKRTGQSFASASNGVVSSAFKMQSANAQVQQAQEQVLQNMADNSKSFVETMQSAMDQMVEMSLKGIEGLNQNLQSVVQASNSQA